MTVTLAARADPRSPEAEAYRVLRSNLGLAGAGAGPQVLAVCAPGPGEGASTVAANLALVVAQGGRQVVLVDANLRRPALQAAFGLPAGPGLAEALADDALAAAPPLVASGVDGLRVLAAGSLPPDPAELLAGPRLGLVLERLRQGAEVVIVDLPPVTAVADAAVVAPQADGLLLVLMAGRSRRDETGRARALLGRVGARILGVALIGAADAGRAPGY